MASRIARENAQPIAQGSESVGSRMLGCTTLVGSLFLLAPFPILSLISSSAGWTATMLDHAVAGKYLQVEISWKDEL